MMKVTEDLQIKHTLEKNRLLKALNVSHQEKINHLGIEYDETLMTLRQNMVAEIFETVTKQLLDYIQSDAYFPAMKYKFDPYAKTYELKQLTVHIKGSDQQLGQFFQSEYPIVKVFSHPNIVIGGFLLTIDDASVEYDHTYDALLKSQKRDVFRDIETFREGIICIHIQYSQLMAQSSLSMMQPHLKCLKWSMLDIKNYLVK